MAQTNLDFQLSTTEQERLKHLWQDAIVPVKQPPDAGTGKALLGGINFRINLIKLFVAAWATGKATVHTTAAAHLPFMWFTWVQLGAEFAGAAAAVFSSFVERMRPIVYVTSVVLSSKPEGLTKPELRKAVEDYLSESQAVAFSWYFGMSESLVRRAKEVLSSEDWFTDVLAELRASEFLDEQDGKLMFKPRHFEIGWKMDR